MNKPRKCASPCASKGSEKLPIPTHIAAAAWKACSIIMQSNEMLAVLQNQHIQNWRKRMNSGFGSRKWIWCKLNWLKLFLFWSWADWNYDVNCKALIQTSQISVIFNDKPHTQSYSNNHNKTFLYNEILH